MRVARARVAKVRIRAPSQLARLRCSNTLAYRFSSKRETDCSLFVGQLFNKLAARFLSHFLFARTLFHCFFSARSVGKHLCT